MFKCVSALYIAPFSGCAKDVVYGKSEKPCSKHFYSKGYAKKNEKKRVCCESVWSENTSL